jgi:hypothetical protein
VGRYRQIGLSDCVLNLALNGILAKRVEPDADKRCPELRDSPYRSFQNAVLRRRRRPMEQSLQPLAQGG